MQKFQNFKVAAYVWAYTMERMTPEQIQYGVDYFKKYMHIDKVYMENHRANTDVSREKMLAAKKIFQDNGIEVSGGITATVMIDEPKPSIFDCFCFTDEKHRQKFRDIVRDIAEVFDEIILDDYFFTPCRCEKCIDAKGSKSWAQYRLDLMEEFSREIVDIAHQVNPKVNFIIKYPNWYEAYQETGYNPGKQKDIFDMIYTGTETRTATYNTQHLQRYESYSIMRLMENIAPGRNGGGWIDQGGCSDNLNVWLEQANLTMFAKGKELMLFNFEVLIDSPALPPLGQEFYRIDKLMGMAGAPFGVATYEPYDGDGEDQLVNYLGMCGIPFEPKPEFDFDAPAILLTATSACGEGIMQKVEQYVRKGGNAIVTVGFLRKMYDKGIKDMTSVRLTNRHILSKEFMVDHYNTSAAQIIKGSEDILFEILDLKNNATWGDILIMAGEDNFPLMTEDYYGKGFLYILNVPENFADLYKLPKAVIGMIGKELTKGLPLYLSCEAKYNLFCYDNDVYGLYCYRDHGDRCDVIVRGDEIVALQDIETGKRYERSYDCPKSRVKGDSVCCGNDPDEYAFTIPMYPGRYMFFKTIKK